MRFPHWFTDLHTLGLVHSCRLCLFHYQRPLLCEYFPEFVANKKKWSLFRGKDCPEYQLASCHAQSYRTYGQLTNIEARKKCYTAYLEFCWKLPYYGWGARFIWCTPGAMLYIWAFPWQQNCQKTCKIFPSLKKKGRILKWLYLYMKSMTSIIQTNYQTINYQTILSFICSMYSP